MIAIVLLPTFGVIPLLSACILAAAAMIVCRCCTSLQAMNSINWPILLVFAGSISFGKSFEVTGVAQMIADWLLNICGSNPHWLAYTHARLRGRKLPLYGFRQDRPSHEHHHPGSKHFHYIHCFSAIKQRRHRSKRQKKLLHL